MYFYRNSLRDPVYREEEEGKLFYFISTRQTQIIYFAIFCNSEAFLGWWSKTPLGRRKQRFIEMEAQAKLEKETGADKKRKK